ncbi:glycan-binding surface protein [Balneolales bacterium ANBcel1]|nr:glycan-binding surface protein [Balneolales bacterium ANBcel1]
MNSKKNISCHSPIAIAMAVLLGLLSTSCGLFGSDDDRIPEITSVRYMHPDTAAVRQLEQLGPGEIFVIQGNNLDRVEAVFFNGVGASFNPVFVTKTNMIITVPDINFMELDPESDEMNTIKVVSDKGEFVFDFPIVPPPPSLSHLTREFGQAGDQIRLYGQSLFLILDVRFPGGISAADFTPSDNGSWVDLVVPDGVTEGGAITVETVNEEVATPPSSPFNDYTGMLNDFDDVNNYEWGALVSDDPDLFPGSIGSYGYMQTGNITPGNWAWWEDTRSVNLVSLRWMEEEHLDDPLQDWALKFDIYIKDPLAYGTFLIRIHDDWDYIARYEPWEDTGGAYTTDGWVTVTIPLSMFRTDNGYGQSAASIRDLHTPDESMGIMFVNDNEGEDDLVESLLVAFDHMRIVRIAD